MDAPAEGAPSTCDAVQSSAGLASPVACEAPYVARQVSSAPTAPLLATAQAHRYLSREFNAIMIHRVAWTLLLLQSRLSVLHCDLDIVWLRDPLAHFAQPPQLAANMLVMSEQSFGNNGGFYLIRQSEPTRSFLQVHMHMLTCTCTCI